MRDTKIEKNASARIKRDAHEHQLPVNQSNSVAAQRQRKIKKFIRKIGNNPNNTLSNMSETNDKINIKRSNNHSDIENTQDEIRSHDSSQLSQKEPNKSSKRRIIGPIRRTRLNPSPPTTPAPSSPPPPTTQSPSDSSESKNPNRSTLSTEQKKKLFVKRRRITPKPLLALEPSIIETESAAAAATAAIEPSSSSSSSSLTPSMHHSIIPKISLELVTRLSTVPRTYTYVVTRVHDNQSETISSTFVRDQIKTLTDTITHTIPATAHTIQPTKTKQIAHTLIN